MLRNNVVLAVFKRNVQSYFSGVLGYLFIVVFVVAGAFAAFNQQFFANNLANLDQLTTWFPLLLLFIIPAITMGVWADEKKLGTDELLFTLPASDIEILLGKFLSVLAVYTIALLFSVTHVFVLWRIGNPDLGLMFATFFWLLAGWCLLTGRGYVCFRINQQHNGCLCSGNSHLAPYRSSSVLLLPRAS